MNDQWVVLLCILGAGVAVFLGWATTRFFFTPAPGDSAGHGNDFSQVQYMREVRLRNAESIAHSYGLSRQW